MVNQTAPISIADPFVAELMSSDIRLAGGEIIDTAGSLCAVEVLARPESVSRPELGANFERLMKEDLNKVYFPVFLKNSLEISGSWEYPPAIIRTINLVPRIFNRRCWQQVMKILLDHPAPEMFALEIVEIAHLPEFAIQDLRRLGRQGYIFYIDDLGSNRHNLRVRNNARYVQGLIRGLYPYIAGVKLDHAISSRLFEEGMMDLVHWNLQTMRSVYFLEDQEDSDLSLTFEFFDQSPGWVERTVDLAAEFGWDDIRFQTG